MHRCFISPAAWTPDTLRPDVEEAHYLAHVLRVREGDTVCVFDGRGRRVEAAIARVPGGGRNVPFVLVPVAGTEQQQPVPAALILYAAVIKGNRMDLLIEKATELGATAIVPLQTERTVVRLAADQVEERCARWQRVAVGAARQCGEDWVAEVRPAVPLGEALRALPREALCLVGSLQAGARPLRDVVGGAGLGGSGAVACLVGPEGDFSEAEYAACVAAGAVPVRLGPRVLRAETAAFYMLSTVTALR